VQGGVTKDRGVVDPAGQASGLFGDLGRPQRDTLVARVAAHRADVLVSIRPRQRVGVAVHRRNVPLQRKARDDRTADPACPARHDVRRRHVGKATQRPLPGRRAGSGVQNCAPRRWPLRAAPVSGDRGGAPRPMSSWAGCGRMGMKSGYADVNGLHLYYEIHGDGGTPLVLLHGGVMTIELTYASLLPTLTERHRVIAVDFQAHGRTADIDRDLTYANLASDVVGLLEALGVERAHVIGHSMGGGTALDLAVNHPERLLSVVPISASVRPEGMHPDLADPSTYATSTRMPTEQDFADMAAAYAKVAPHRSGSTTCRRGR
jgi:alpha/beta hydrolase fold